MSASREYSSSASRDVSYGGESSRSSSPSKISLGALKTPTIQVWDEMGILGLSSKLMNQSSMMKEGFITSSSTNSYVRRESVTTKVM